MKTIYILILVLFGVLMIYGCDNIKKCYPEVGVKDGYIGFKCIGEF